MDSTYALPPPLGSIKASQFQAALDRFGLGTLQAVAPAASGNFNQNVFLTTNRGEFVFRGAPHYDWQFPHERYFAELISTRTTVTVPWPYHLHTQRDIFAWPFVIMPRLPGDQPYPAAVIEDEFCSWPDIARAQADALVALHKANFDVPSTFSLAEGALRSLDVSYADWVVGEIARLVAATGSLSAEEGRWLLDEAATLRQYIAPVTASTFVHGDFSYMNMVFAWVNAEIRVSGLFDLMTAMIGDGLADLSRQFAMYCDLDRMAALTFVSHYLEQSATPVPDGYHRFNLYQVHERLIVRDFAYRQGVDWIDWNTPCRDWFESYLLTRDQWETLLPPPGVTLPS